MKFYKDTNNYYLRKILDDIELSKFTTSWVFYEWENGINVGDFLRIKKYILFYGNIPLRKVCDFELD